MRASKIHHWWYSAGRAWYVREAGATVGGDGLSYATAWAGDAEIVWNDIPDGGRLIGAGTWVEALTVGKSNVTIESLIADPLIIDCNDAINRGFVIDTLSNITVTGITVIDAIVSCSDVLSSTGIVFNSCSFSGSGNQSAQNQGTSVVIYNDCTFNDNVDDGISLHETANVTANRCTISNSTQGVNGINSTTFIGNDCIFSGNTTGIQPDTDGNFTINRCLFTGQVTNNVLANSTISMKINNCRFNGALVRSNANKDMIINDSHFLGNATVLSLGTCTVSNSYFKGTISGMVGTQTAGVIIVDYCAFYITTGTNIYAMVPNSSGAFTANNCTIAGQNNLGRGVNASLGGAVTLNNCILTDLSVGYVSTGATNVVTANFCDVFDVTTIASVFTSGTVTRNNEITTDPELTLLGSDNFTSGNNMKNVGTSTGVTTGIGSATWGDANTAPVVVSAEQAGTYDLGSYI